MMVQWWEALILGAVQGVTEFLPASSTGHLVLFERILGIESSGLTFDVLVHFGTLLAVCIFFRKDLWRLLNTYWRQIFWATVPAILFTLLFKSWIEDIREDTVIMSLSYVFNAILLVIASVLLPTTEGDGKGRYALLQKLQDFFRISRSEKITELQAFLIGVFQALAIVGLSRETAFTFAFLISIPAVLGAIVFTWLDGSQAGSVETIGGVSSLIAVLASAITGYFSLSLLRSLIRKNNLWVFAAYCLFVAFLIVFFA
jgi:undecaprenyl-diphosphatase